MTYEKIFWLVSFQAANTTGELQQNHHPYELCITADTPTNQPLQHAI